MTSINHPPCLRLLWHQNALTHVFILYTCITKRIGITFVTDILDTREPLKWDARKYVMLMVMLMVMVFFLRISFLCSNHCWKCFVIVFKEMTCRFLFQAKWHFSKILQSRFLFAVNFLGFSQFYWVCSDDEIRINGRSALKVMQHPASKCLQRENFVATIKSLPAGFFERSTQIIHQTFFQGSSSLHNWW